MQAIMSETKSRMEHSVPFAMEPVVYDFAINEQGTHAALYSGDEALMPPGYYTQQVPPLIRTEMPLLSPTRRAELERFTAACRSNADYAGMIQTLFDHMLPATSDAEGSQAQTLRALLDQHGFDRQQHEQLRQDLRSGRIGLAQNRLPTTSLIEDAAPEPVGRTSSRRRPRSAGRWTRCRGNPCRRRGHALDARGRSRQGPQSLLQTGRTISQFH